MRKLQEDVKKSILLPKIVLTFHCLNKLFSKILQILSLQPRISIVFLDHQNNFFTQQVRTILVTKYHRSSTTKKIAATLGKNCQGIIYVLDLEVNKLFIDSGCESRTYVNAILLKYVCIFISAKFFNQSFGFEFKMHLWCVYYVHLLSWENWTKKWSRYNPTSGFF